MRPEPTADEVRNRLAVLADQRGVSLAALSRMIGRGDRYLARFTAGGPPERLDQQDRAQLAAFFGVPPRELGEWDNPDERNRR